MLLVCAVSCRRLICKDKPGIHKARACYATSAARRLTSWRIVEHVRQVHASYMFSAAFASRAHFAAPWDMTFPGRWQREELGSDISWQRVGGISRSITGDFGRTHRLHQAIGPAIAKVWLISAPLLPTMAYIRPCSKEQLTSLSASTVWYLLPYE